MAESFVDVPVETDAQTLADSAVENLRQTWDGWEPNDADLEVVQIETLAPMAANAAETASRVPSAIFRAFGTKLAGTPYETGTLAATALSFTLTDTAGHTIPAGTEAALDGYVFVTTEDGSAALGETAILNVPVQAADTGSEYNVEGDSVQMITALPFVASVTADAGAEGGSDAEDDDAYQNRLARERRLSSKTLVTARDYELLGLSTPGIGRIAVSSDPVNRQIVVTVADAAGEMVPTVVKDALAASYDEFRLSNWQVLVSDPAYVTVSVTYTVHAYPSVDSADLLERVSAMLTQWLSPDLWGRPKNFGDPGTATGFPLDPVVRRLKLVDLMGDVDGVDYVVDLAITGSAGTVDANGDLTMPGVSPLPQPGVMTGSVS